MSEAGTVMMLLAGADDGTAESGTIIKLGLVVTTMKLFAEKVDGK
jgi:hypothetical protein